VASWIGSADELDRWASLRGVDVTPELFAGWHAEPDVHPFVLVDGADVVGYGEVWSDDDHGEAELARIVVDPRRRGRGVGRRLTQLLVGEARARGFDEVWLRVVPTNAVAIASYRGAGFERGSGEEEAAFNAGQPRAYVWMHAPRA
jgi:ribosomal protein S18 acetylase RimI-like enzyme